MVMANMASCFPSFSFLRQASKLASQQALGQVAQHKSARFA